ncbi:hypothetical protein MJM04_31785, partial [Salmonella enterica subsp. enterica serovar Cerro]|nr:hypothetical protein [Salmonella enterica subsp. enterica serovar Cerro]
VGADLAQTGAMALLVALISILVYVGFRFEWRLAAGVVIALAHVLFTLSGSVLSSSLQDQLAAVAQAEQQGKNEENRQRDALQAK